MGANAHIYVLSGARRLQRGPCRGVRPHQPAKIHDIFIENAKIHHFDTNSTMHSFLRVCPSSPKMVFFIICRDTHSLRIVGIGEYMNTFFNESTELMSGGNNEDSVEH